MQLSDLKEQLSPLCVRLKVYYLYYRRTMHEPSMERILEARIDHYF